jgi:hypothetical protein
MKARFIRQPFHRLLIPVFMENEEIPFREQYVVRYVQVFIKRIIAGDKLDLRLILFAEKVTAIKQYAAFADRLILSENTQKVVQESGARTKQCMDAAPLDIKVEIPDSAI